MKTTFLFPTLALLTFVFGSCTEAEKPAAASAAKATGDYPLTTCVVSGEELGGMGEPVVYDYQGTTVKFCCQSCVPKFEKDPAPFLAKLK